MEYNLERKKQLPIVSNNWYSSLLLDHAALADEFEIALGFDAPAASAILLSRPNACNLHILINFLPLVNLPSNEFRSVSVMTNPTAMMLENDKVF